MLLFGVIALLLLLLILVVHIKGFGAMRITNKPSPELCTSAFRRSELGFRVSGFGFGLRA